MAVRRSRPAPVSTLGAGNGLSERLQTPISTAELERRWGLVRAAMKREGVDVLLMQNNNDHMGGYVKWFTDMPATNGYPNTVIFPAVKCTRSRPSLGWSSTGCRRAPTGTRSR